MVETASLIIKIDSSGADRATRSLDHLDRASGKTERAANKLGKAWGIALGVIGSAAVATATREFIRQADAFANMSARIGLVTKSEKELIATRKALFGLSQRTASDMEATADLYVKMAQSSEELRNNQDALLTVTEAVSKALVVSGSDAASSAAVIRQFSQALASGALRGDEFVSVMEGAPRLARAIADGLGVPIGKLRELAAQGELTTEKMVAAVQSQSEVLDREFGKMPLTVGRAVDKMQNSLLLLIGKSDESSKASQGLAQSISDMADVLSSPETQQAFGEVVKGLSAIVTTAAKAAGAVATLSAKVDSLSGLSLPEWTKVLFQGATGNFVGAVDSIARGRIPDAPAAQGVSEGIDFTRPAPLPGDPSGQSGTTGTGGAESTNRATTAIRDNTTAKREAILATTDFDRATLAFEETQREWSARLEEITAQLEGPAAEATLDYRRKLDELNGAKARGVITATDAVKWEQALGEEYRRNVGAIDDYTRALQDQELVAKADSTRAIFEDLLVGLPKRGKSAWQDFLDSFETMMLRMASKNLVEKVFGAYGTTGQGSAGGDWLGALFGGASGGSGNYGEAAGSLIDLFSGDWGLASGGRMRANSAARVNENGLEMASVGGKDYLLTGAQPAHITPNHMLRGRARRLSSDVNISQTIVVQGRMDRRTSDQIARSTLMEARLALARTG